MKLDELCESFEELGFPGYGERSHPEEITVRGARALIFSAVADDAFLADCFSHELQLIASDCLRQGLVPFFTLPGLGIQFAFGYWAPGATPGPHEHTAWTITALCRNELEILVYDRQQSYQRRELVPKARFRAEAGEVGFIHAPCIHAPKNVSRDWSLTIHVTSPRDGEPLPSQPDPELVIGLNAPPWLSPANLDHPYSKVMRARQRARHVRHIVRVLADMEVPQALSLFARCHDLASSSTRRLIERVAPLASGGEAKAFVLARSHADLVLSHREEDSMIALYAETPAGPQEELAINGIAREAIAFAAKETLFDVRALPGMLSDEERVAIGESLEDTGLFTRVRA
jgi:hypothetical protein